MVVSERVINFTLFFYFYEKFKTNLYIISVVDNVRSDQIMGDLVSILVIAVLIQVVVDQIKKLIKLPKGYKYSINIKVLLAVVISICVCLCGNIQLLSLLGIQLANQMLDCILTGVIVSAGASGVNDLISKLTDLKTK